MEELELREREKWVDAVKGFAIYLVILGHSIQYATSQDYNYAGNTIFQIIYSFHMPLFMMMLREGTRRYDAARIAEKLDYYGAWLELSSASEYAYVTLYSLNKYLPQTLDILESIVKEPVFPEKELGVIVDNNIQQFLVNSSKVDFLAHRGLVKALYGGQHPGGRLVQEEDYRRITPAVLREFYDRYYHSNNCSIYLSGKVTGDCIHRIEIP